MQHTTITLLSDTWITPVRRVKPCETLVADTWQVTTRTHPTSEFQPMVTITDTKHSRLASSQLRTLRKLSQGAPAVHQLVTTVLTVTTGTNTRPDVMPTSICLQDLHSIISRSLSMVMTATIDFVSDVTVTST